MTVTYHSRSYQRFGSYALQYLRERICLIKINFYIKLTIHEMSELKETFFASELLVWFFKTERGLRLKILGICLTFLLNYYVYFLGRLEVGHCPSDLCQTEKPPRYWMVGWKLERRCRRAVVDAVAPSCAERDESKVVDLGRPRELQG